MTASAPDTDLSRLFAPRSVVLVGASNQGERFGTRVFRRLLNFGFREIAYRIVPVTPEEAASMLRQLRGYKLLEGVRGARPADIDALVATIVRLSWFAHDFADSVVELEINPLLVFERGAGVKVVDALIVPG